MKILYIPIQTGGRLQVYDATDEEGRALIRKVTQFVYSHHRLVLQKYYEECKVSNVYFPSNNIKQPDGSFVLINFFSAVENHLPYLQILQKELQLDIQDMPNIN